MSEVQELLKKARDAGSAARGGTTTEPKKSGKNIFKAAFSEYIFDLGDGEPVSGSEILNDPAIASVDFDIPNTGDAGSKPFADIYEEAGITSTYSVDQFDTLLNSEKIKLQPVAMKQVAIPAILDALNVTIDVPIMDAAKRDAALDSYAESLLASTTTSANDNTAKEADIEAEMRAYFETKQAEIDALRQDTLNKEASYRNFLERKREEEERMVKIISPFLGGKANPVTVGNEPIVVTPEPVFADKKAATK